MSGPVLVTGGSRGIGRAIVDALVAEGRSVAFTYSKDEASARAVEEASGGRARAFQLDLQDRGRPRALVPEVEAAMGELEGLVNNAGVRRESILAMTSDRDWDLVIEVNLGGVFRCCRAVLPGMIHRRRGSIVNVSSLSAIRGLSGQTAYAATKSGLLGLTRALAREVGRKGVRVNAVLPGLVATDLTSSLPDEVTSFLRSTECLPQGTRPTDVAAAVAFLLSGASAAITGQALVVDAGSFGMSGTPATERPHAPVVGWSQRLFGAIHVTGVFWFSGTYRFLGWAPDWLVRLTVSVFTGGFFFALLRIRAAIAANLEPVLGPCGFWERQRRIFRTMYSFAWCYTERYQYLHAPEKFTIRAEGQEHLEAAAGPGEGIVFVTAHVGHWESASHLMPSSLDRQVHVVREEELDPRAQAFMQELLSRHGQARYKTHFATDDPRLGILLAQALRRGDMVALQGDRPRAAGRSLTATLFGRPMALPAGPAALARAASVSLVPVFGFRTGPRSYSVCLREPIRVSAEGDRDAAIQEATRRLASEIEWAIRREPHQWFCFRTLWARSR